MAEAPSVTTFVMEDRLPWPEQNIATGLGGPFDRGLIYDHGQARQCSIRSISALGATLCGEVMNAPGEEVALELATGSVRPVRSNGPVARRHSLQAAHRHAGADQSQAD
jgi:hypothetical protein